MVASPISSPVATAGAAWGEPATWHWRGLDVHWRRLGDPANPALVLIHGFGAASGHWRHNAGPLAEAGWCAFDGWTRDPAFLAELALAHNELCGPGRLLVV